MNVQQNPGTLKILSNYWMNEWMNKEINDWICRKACGKDKTNIIWLLVASQRFDFVIVKITSPNGVIHPLQKLIKHNVNHWDS